MTETYDLTNPITDALGDEHTLREVTMTNHSTMTRIETLTNTEIPAGQTVLVRVLGDIGHEQLISQIQQINELKGFEVIGVTSVAVADETGGGDPLDFDYIYAGSYGGGQLSYSHSTIHLGEPVNQDLPALFATRAMDDGMRFEFPVVTPISQTAGCLGIIFSASSNIIEVITQGLRVDVSPINADVNNLTLSNPTEHIPLEAGYTVKGKLNDTIVELKVYDGNTLIGQTTLTVDPTDLKIHVFAGFDNTEQAFTQPIILLPALDA